MFKYIIYNYINCIYYLLLTLGFILILLGIVVLLSNNKWYFLKLNSLLNSFKNKFFFFFIGILSIILDFKVILYLLLCVFTNHILVKIVFSIYLFLKICLFIIFLLFYNTKK